MNRKNIERINHVFGNVLRLGISLTKRVVNVSNGNTSYTDEDFIPTGAVSVELSSGVRTLRYTATMDGNVAMITDNGSLPAGVYAVAVYCKDENGFPYTFKRKTVVHVHEYTADAGIRQSVEFESKVWYLDAAVYLVPVSSGGGGIVNETDPVFSASPAAGITNSDIQRWNQQGGGGSFIQEQADWNETDSTEPAYIKNKPTIPVVPANVSSFTNDAGYLTQHQDISGKANSADLATVATSGSYNDLTNKPTIPAAQVQSDWNATTGMGVILNKPTVPTNVSSFTNDAGYLTAHQSLSGYAKFVRCQDEAEYNALPTKDSTTLYLIPES